MYSLIYVSTAVSTFSADDLPPLVEVSAARNAERDVTGLLAFNGFNFMQLLEGEQAQVEDRMTRIGADPRHSGIIVIRQGEVSARECAEWAMAGKIVPPKGLSYADTARTVLPASLSSETLQLFASFASLSR